MFVDVLYFNPSSLISNSQEIPIHPLDLTAVNGEGTCIASYQYIDNGPDPNYTDIEYDLLLGAAFLRNVYALYNYGDIPAGGFDVETAFIQFLPLTDPQSALADFQSSRESAASTTSCSYTVALLLSLWSAYYILAYHYVLWIW